MREIKSDNYGPLTQTLLLSASQESRPATLIFGTPVVGALADLRAMNAQNISSNRRVRMPADEEALRAGLWLLFDYMEQSHTISQSIATPSGSYWHAILHRREPDAPNSKYWFARVGEHPVFPELLADSIEIVSATGASGAATLKKLESMSAWDAGWFVDRCTGHNDPDTTRILIEIQRREWQLLFDYNFRKAFA